MRPTRIYFHAVRSIEGSFKLTDEDFDDATEAGIDVEDAEAMAAYLEKKFERGGYMDDIVDDESDYTDTDIQEWYAQ